MKSFRCHSCEEVRSVYRRFEALEHMKVGPRVRQHFSKRWKSAKGVRKLKYTNPRPAVSVWLHQDNKGVLRVNYSFEVECDEGVLSVEEARGEVPLVDQSEIELRREAVRKARTQLHYDRRDFHGVSGPGIREIPSPHESIVRLSSDFAT